MENSHTAIISREDLELLRDLTFRRRPDLALRTLPSVRRFIDRVGFAFLYRARGSVLPSVWGAISGRRDPKLPEHTHHDPGVGLAWEAKDVLAARKQIYYGKILRRSPTLVSLELFPMFYALSGNRGADDDFLRWVRAGLLSFPARRIMEVLLANPPLTTGDLKALSGYAGGERRTTFDRAVAELQERMLLAKYAELYDPKFTFIWGPLHRWLPDPIRASRGITQMAAREEILERHLEVKWASTVLEIRRLFGWPAPATSETLRLLREKGTIVPCILEPLREPGFAIGGIEEALGKLRRSRKRRGSRRGVR